LRWTGDKRSWSKADGSRGSQGEAGDTRESSGGYVQQVHLPLNTTMPSKKGHRRGARFGRASCESEQVQHRWRMRDGESRLIELNEVGEAWVRMGDEGIRR
jgi:hypothetical protein